MTTYWCSLICLFQICILLPDIQGPQLNISHNSLDSYYNLQKSELLNSTWDGLSKFSAWYANSRVKLKIGVCNKRRFLLFIDCDLHYETECDAQMSIWCWFPKKKKCAAPVHGDVITFKSTSRSLYLCGWMTMNR